MPNKRQQKKNIKIDYNFNVGKKTLEAYKREVKNTKAKISRLKREKNVDISGEISIPDLESFSSRKELNAWVKEVKSFRDRKNLDYQFDLNQYGVSASKSRLKKIEEKTVEAQKLADKEISKFHDLPFFSGGKEQGTVGMQRPNKTGISRPADFKFEEVRSKDRLDDIEGHVGKKSNPLHYDERMETMKENFINILRLSFNSDADKLIDKIDGLSADVFYQMYLEFDEFDFELYDSEGQMVTANEGTITQMMSDIERYEKGELDTDMWHKNFS